MSDKGGTFLARWSKRKAEARLGEPNAEAGKPPAAPARTPPFLVADDKRPQRFPSLVADDKRPLQTPPAGEDGGEAEVPLADLPPIESITSDTDLTPWLRRKLPEEWKRAALSRVWAADPAISQFIGLAENTWDWNAPDGVPGFGPLHARDDIAQLLAQAIGQPSPASETPEAGEVVAETGEVPAAESNAPEQISPPMTKKASDETFIDEGATPEFQPGAKADKSATEAAPVIRRRRGGGAMPS